MFKPHLALAAGVVLALPTPALAIRTISMYPITSTASQHFPTSDGFAAQGVFTFTSLDPSVDQVVTVTLSNETVSGTIGVVNALGLTGWTPLFGGVNVWATGTVYSRPTRSMSVPLPRRPVGSAPSTGQAFYGLTCAFDKAGMFCPVAAVPPSSDLAVQRDCTVASATRNIVCAQEGSWSFTATITVDNDLGAVVGAVFTNGFMYGGGLQGGTQSDRFNFPINGGRPF